MSEEDITVYKIGQYRWVKYEDYLKAIKQERETCAQIVETAPDFLQNSSFDGAAAAIRNRKGD